MIWSPHLTTQCHTLSAQWVWLQRVKFLINARDTLFGYLFLKVKNIWQRILRFKDYPLQLRTFFRSFCSLVCVFNETTSKKGVPKWGAFSTVFTFCFIPKIFCRKLLNQFFVKLFGFSILGKMSFSCCNFFLKKYLIRVEFETSMQYGVNYMKINW